MARRQVGVYPQHTERGGKWLVFVPVEQVDRAWDLIKRATESGRLGGSSEVATALPNPNATSTMERVIRVYTYDAEDAQDVRRIRQVLRELGFVWTMSYKTDAASRAGYYSARGYSNIGKYRE